MGEARRRGTRADRMAAPKGGEWRRTRRIDRSMDLAIVGDEATELRAPSPELVALMTAAVLHGAPMPPRFRSLLRRVLR